MNNLTNSIRNERVESIFGGNYLTTSNDRTGNVNNVIGVSVSGKFSEKLKPNKKASALPKYSTIILNRLQTPIVSRNSNRKVCLSNSISSSGALHTSFFGNTKKNSENACNDTLEAKQAKNKPIMKNEFSTLKIGKKHDFPGYCHIDYCLGPIDNALPRSIKFHDLLMIDNYNKTFNTKNYFFKTLSSKNAL